MCLNAPCPMQPKHVRIPETEDGLAGLVFEVANRYNSITIDSSKSDFSLDRSTYSSMVY